MSEINGAWFDYGFAGAVTGTLLTATFLIVKWALSFADRLQKSHTTEREEWREEAKQIRDEHRSERSEWMEGVNRISANHHNHLDKVCDSLKDSIRDIALRDRNRDRGN